MFDTLAEELDDPQLAELVEVERESARLFVRQCRALLAVWESTPAGSRTGDRPQVLAEVAWAVGLSERSVAGRLDVAMTLSEQPLLTTLLDGGGLGVPHALVACDEVAGLAQNLAGRVLTEVLACAGRLGWSGPPGRLRLALRRAVLRADPDAAAQRRRREAHDSCGVRLRMLTGGSADWVATGPAVQLGAAHQLLDCLSGRAGPQDERSRGQRQLDALLAALAARAGRAVPVEVQLQLPAHHAVAAVVAGLPEPVVIRSDLTSELLAQLYAAAAPTTPSAGAAGSAPTDGCPQVTGEHDTAPRAVASGEHEVPAAAPPASTPRRDNPPGWPYGGVPELVGCGPVDTGLLAELLDDPAGLPLGLGGVRLRRLFVDRTGQVVAADPTATPLRRLTNGASDARTLVEWLAGPPPSPPPRVAGYTPSAGQHRVVTLRDRVCSWPGCARSAARCDLDHLRRWPDGPTSTANLHPLCRRHHRLKHDGWRATRHPDGSTTWTSPRSQRRRTRPP